MSGPLIRLGDKTSHGGVVIQASPHSDIAGVGIARMGDKTVCPIHGNAPITNGGGTFIVDGKYGRRINKDNQKGHSMKSGILIASFIAAAILSVEMYHARADNMAEVSVDIGKNIFETAKNSGAPRFGRESHLGLQIYELVDLKPDVVIHYSRPGYQITASPLFSLTMYADSENNNNLAVERIELQYRNEPKTHDNAKVFVEDILKQFNQGNWKRHISETCPAVSGRSNYLDVSGKIVYDFCTLDPLYRIPTEDWIELMGMGRSFEWLGDGVLARLDVRFSDDSRGLTYSVEVNFQDYAIENRRSAAAQERHLIEGDRKGWKSTENFKKNAAESKVQIKILEDNAVRRGDRLVSRN